jgi:predicted nucleotide-binding protein
MTVSALLKPASEVHDLITALIAAGRELDEETPALPSELSEFRHAYLSWDERCSTVLQMSFETSGILSTGPLSEYKAVGLSLLDLRLTMTSLPADRLNEVKVDILGKIRVLASIRDRLDLYNPPTATAPRPDTASAIFLVHGRDLVRREKVRRFLEKICDLPVIVLEDQPNKGRDVLGKLLENASMAAFAIVLMTPDDEGRTLGEEPLHPRARQNVILELGLFLGLLGRSRVVALYEESVEIPSDYVGVMWVPIAGERWMLDIATELKEAGISVSLDKAL